MKHLPGCAAIAMIAVLLAPLGFDGGVVTSAAEATFVNGPLIAALKRCATQNQSCHGGDGVCSETRGMSAVPPLVLWAWERAEDLRFLDSGRVGVAFLAGTVRLGADGMTFKPRMQPLRVSPQTKLVAVVRIETAARAAHKSARGRAQLFACTEGCGGDCAGGGGAAGGRGAGRFRRDGVAARVLSRGTGGSQAGDAGIHADLDYRACFVVHWGSVDGGAAGG